MRPFFSIITVTKNSEKKIELTIRSVLSQNFKNFEYIIIDGFSKDSTFLNIKKYKDKKIKIFRNKDNSFYESLNYGVQKSTGKYLAILNSGDFFYSNKILSLMKKKILEFDKYQFFFSNIVCLNKNNKIKRIWKNFYSNKSLEDGFKIPHLTIFIKRVVAQKFKYDENYKISSDLDFILRLLEQSVKFKYLNFFSIVMEIGGMSSNLKYSLIKLREDLIIHRKYFKNYIYHFLIQKVHKLKTLFFQDQKIISNRILKTKRDIS